MKNRHNYSTTVRWTGNTGNGTSNYKAYERSHIISTSGKPEILCSSDPTFRGDDTKYNPEELLLSSLSACHMLQYLHLCSINKINVIEYSDQAIGVMEMKQDGSGQFTEVVLNPIVSVTDETMLEKALELHKLANKLCFIAKSVNFEVKHRPKCHLIDSHV